MPDANGLIENEGMGNPPLRRIGKLSGDSLRVSPDGSGVWRLLFRWGRQHFDDQHEAIRAGVRFARVRDLRQIVVEREDGSVQEEIFFW